MVPKLTLERGGFPAAARFCSTRGAAKRRLRARWRAGHDDDGWRLSGSQSHQAPIIGGEWHGNYGLAPGPGHSKADRSLHISPHETDPDDVVLHSYAGDDWKAIKDELRARGVLLGPKLPRENVTLEAYADAKHLPVPFLRELGLKTENNPWGHDQQVWAIPIAM